VTGPGGAALGAEADPVDATLAAYQHGAAQYLQARRKPGPALTAFLDRLAALTAGGNVLEIGSGPGWDADYLEARGVRVTRTDATQAFVDQQRAAGHDARLLDVRWDPLGHPYQAVLANAVLLHLPRPQFVDAVQRARQAVVPGGTLAVTLKEGDGARWTHEKLPMPRHFTYWREPELRAALARAGWSGLSVEHVAGSTEPWLYVMARAADPQAP
jgi:SAM-dependent methyltransferase